MRQAPTLPGDGARDETPAPLDFEALKREGVKELERLSGSAWTDFNDHDPGITILEALCYALSDVVYRTEHDIADLLASQGADPWRGLFSAADLLGCRPVTLDDLRRLLLDVPAVRNAQVEALYAPGRPWPAGDELAVHSRPLRSPDAPTGFDLLAGLPEASEKPLSWRGLYRVRIEDESPESSRPGPLSAAARALQANRPVAGDFAEIRALEPEDVRIYAHVEIDPAAHPETVLAEILLCLSRQISPAPTFHTLDELLRAGKTVDEVRVGPVLSHGFLDPEPPEPSRGKAELHASDLLTALLDLEGVRAVRDLHIAVVGSPGSQDWTLVLDENKAARLHVEDDPGAQAPIVLERDGRPVRVDGAAVAERFKEGLRRRKRPSAPGGPRAGSISVLESARDRRVDRHHPIQTLLPALYRLGSHAAGPDAPAEHRAQARNLGAYLSIFDQLLASSCRQLAHLGDLLSCGEAPQGGERTDFAGTVEGADLGGLYLSPSEHASRVERIAQAAAGDPVERRRRLLDHLLARFAEDAGADPLGPPGTVDGPDAPAADSASLRRLSFRRDLLREYPNLSGSRGTGTDLLAEPAQAGISGLETWLHRHLGLDPDTAARSIFLVEHILLRPRDFDVRHGPVEKKEPLLTLGSVEDPYSLRLTYVLDSSLLAAHRERIEHALREHSPAHLSVSALWLEPEAWQETRLAHDDWLNRYRRWTAARYTPPAPGKPAVPFGRREELCLRAARDRFTDLLFRSRRFGWTYPLQDVMVEVEQKKVAHGSSCIISITPGQPDVKYQLLSSAGLPVGTAVVGKGHGEETPLESTAVTHDTVFQVLATKIASGLSTLLFTRVAVQVGIDDELSARIEAPPLDPSAEPVADRAPRIVDYGTAAITVVIDRSQRGVSYRLVSGENAGAAAVLSEDVQGTGKEIRLVTRGRLSLNDDLWLRIRAEKHYPDGTVDSAWLKTELPLAVRADPALAVTAPQPVVDHDATAQIVLDRSQAGVDYRLFSQNLRDSQVIYDPEAEDDELLAVPVEGAGTVRVEAPPWSAAWQSPDGFGAAAPAVTSDGGPLELPMTRTTEDRRVVVQATKTHPFGSGPELTSAVQLRDAALVLARPDPRPRLICEIDVDEQGSVGPIRVAGGEPGVFYTFHRQDGHEVGQAVYFHQVHEQDPDKDQGVGEEGSRIGMRIGRDFVVARPADDRDRDLPDRASVRPPEVDLGRLAWQTRLGLRARRARTGVTEELTDRITVTSCPAIRLRDEAVVLGQAAEILVENSRRDELYQPFVDGSAFAESVPGNGGTIRFTSGPLTDFTTFFVHVRPVKPATIEAIRRVRLHARVVRPL